MFSAEKDEEIRGDIELVLLISKCHLPLLAVG